MLIKPTPDQLDDMTLDDLLKLVVLQIAIRGTGHSPVVDDDIREAVKVAYKEEIDTRPTPPNPS